MRVTHSLLLSLAIHLSVVYVLLWGYTQREMLTSSAGRSGESVTGLQVALLSSSAMQWQAATSSSDTAVEEPVPPVLAASSSQATLPVNSQAVVTLEVSKPAPRRPQKDSPVNRREESTAVVRKVKQPPDERKPPVAVSTPSPGMLNRDRGYATAQPASGIQASAPVSGNAPSAPQGNHAEGRAEQGAGDGQSQVVKALQRRVNYPTRARAMGVEGRVRLQFDITDSGTVTAIRVLSEDPAGMFSHDVIKDMARWRYQSGTAAANQTVSVIFQLNGHIELQR
ncbi:MULTISPECIES: TonB family protein [Dickeya]|uniref:TonB family protein n=1 Tax=Dickeya TaxID=204037 RepID=UPI0003A6CE56|nr:MULTISPECIES: TonB family protein [Dickeya]